MPDTSPFEMTASEEAALAAEAAAARSAGRNDATGGDAAPEGRERTVPHGALHAERAEHKKTRAALEEERRQRAAEGALFEERLRVLRELGNAAGADGPGGEGGPEADHEADVADSGDPSEEEAAAIAAFEAAMQAAADSRPGDGPDAAAAADPLLADYRASVAEVAAAEPDFPAAYDFLVDSRAREMSLAGYQPAEIRRALDLEERAIALAALQAGENPAERLMALARHRGWQSGAGDSAATERLDRLAAGQAGAKSLSQAGGSAAAPDMTVTRLLRMSDDDFQAWCDKHPARAKRIMGG